MSGADFLDTNILVYAYDSRFPAKQAIAQGLLRKAILGDSVTSSQVLGEFATTLLHKFSPAATFTQLIEILDALSPIKSISIDSETVRRAVETNEKYNLHFYDALIVATAERAGCRQILTEDLNPGQKYFGVLAVNPFS